MDIFVLIVKKLASATRKLMPREDSNDDIFTDIKCLFHFGFMTKHSAFSYLYNCDANPDH